MANLSYHLTCENNIRQDVPTDCTQQQIDALHMFWGKRIGIVAPPLTDLNIVGACRDWANGVAGNADDADRRSALDILDDDPCAYSDPWTQPVDYLLELAYACTMEVVV